MGAWIVISGLVQMFNAERARGASMKRLEEIKKSYDSVVPPNYDLSIDEPPELHQERLQLPEFSGPQAGPEWDLKKLEPAQLQMLENFTPEIAQLVYETEPTLIEKSEDMQMGAEAEKKALRRWIDIGEGDFDPVYQQRVKEARDRTQAEAQARTAAIQQDFARRGIGGSGLELAAKLGTSAQSMDRQAQMGMQAEAQAYQNQLEALSRGAQLGGKIQDRDISLQGRNAQIINDFNKRMSSRQQNWEQMRAQQLNAADLRNMQEAQRISETNTLQQNRYDQAHQSRMDNIAMRNYQARIDEANRQDAIKKWQYGAEGAERARQDNAAILKAKWLQDQKRYANTMAARQYSDRMGGVAGNARIRELQARGELMAGQDQNAAIQGMTNMGILYSLMGNKQPPAAQSTSSGYGAWQGPRQPSYFPAESITPPRPAPNYRWDGSYKQPGLSDWDWSGSGPKIPRYRNNYVENY